MSSTLVVVLRGHVGLSLGLPDNMEFHDIPCKGDVLIDLDEKYVVYRREFNYRVGTCDIYLDKV